MSLNARHRRSVAKIVLAFLVAAVLVSTEVDTAESAYVSGQYRFRYDCIYDRSGFKCFTCDMTFVVNQNDYQVSHSESIVVPSIVTDLIVSYAVIDASRLTSLLQYTSGVRHTSWGSDNLVYDDAFGSLKVYSAKSGIIRYMEGNFTIDLVDSYVRVMMVADLNTAPVDNQLSPYTLLLIFVAGGIFAAYLIYVFVFKRRVEVTRRLKSIEKSGSKLRNYQKKNDRPKKETPKKKSSGAPL